MWISIIRFTRVKIRNVKGIWNLCAVFIIIEYRAYKLCVLVCSSGIIFGKVCLWPESGTVIFVVLLHPLIPGCIV